MIKLPQESKIEVTKDIFPEEKLENMVLREKFFPSNPHMIRKVPIKDKVRSIECRNN